MNIARRSSGSGSFKALQAGITITVLLDRVFKKFLVNNFLMLDTQIYLLGCSSFITASFCQFPSKDMHTDTWILTVTTISRRIYR